MQKIEAQERDTKPVFLGVFIIFLLKVMVHGPVILILGKAVKVRFLAYWAISCSTSPRITALNRMAKRMW